MSSDPKYDSRLQGSSEETLIKMLQVQVLRKTCLYVTFNMCKTLTF